MIYVGVDPGKSGGIAAVDDGGFVVGAEPMPETDRGILDLLALITKAADRHTMGEERFAYAYLERVSSSPGMGVASSFTFGSNVGALRMALTAARIPFEYVHPSVWTRAMGVSAPKGESRRFGDAKRKPRDKNISKVAAERLFPNVKITHAIAEALLIAEYARRAERGTVQRPPRKREQSVEKALFR